MTTTLDTAPAAVLDNLPGTERAAILRAVAASKHPRTALPTIASNHHLTVDEVRYLVTRHGGLENPARLLKAAAVLERNSQHVDDEPAATGEAGRKLSRISVDLLHPDPENVREDVGDVTELAESIVAVGLLQPIVARRHNGRLFVVAGHRRLAAIKHLGWDEVDVIVREDMRPDHVLAAMLIENSHRTDLDPIEEARGLARLKTQLGGVTDMALARRVGRTQGFVSGRLALLALSAEEQAQVRAGALGVTVAIAKGRVDSGRVRPSAKGKAGPAHLSIHHPLGSRAQARCTQLGHSRGKGKGVGGVACGECWESVIRASEREQLHAHSATTGDCALCSAPVGRTTAPEGAGS